MKVSHGARRKTRAEVSRIYISLEMKPKNGLFSADSFDAHGIVHVILLARAPVDGSVMMDVLPSMIFLGLGAGISFSPLLLAAMSDVAPSESGLASGIFSTACMMGGALGLAILAGLSAAARTGVG